MTAADRLRDLAESYARMGGRPVDRQVAAAPDLARLLPDALDALQNHDCPHPIDFERGWPKCEVCALLAEAERLWGNQT